MKMRSLTCLGSGCILLAATNALGQTSRDDAELTEAPSPASTETLRTKPTSGYFMWRLALLGTYRSLYDLTVEGAGGEFSFGREERAHGGHGALRYFRGVTAAGLCVTDIGTYGSYEFHWSGLRLGVGGGMSLLRVQRITTDRGMYSPELEAFTRLGYDFGERSGVTLFTHFAMYSHGLGSSLYVGYRF